MEESPTQEHSPVVELRQYTLRPGQRDVLIDLFDRLFVEGQEGAGITVIGQFRDLDAEDRFVWLRSFPDMESRARSLAAFYDGPVWRAHRDAANATMVDSDNVLLLRPAHPGSMFHPPGGRTAGGSRRVAHAAPVGAAVYALHDLAAEARIVSWFESVTAGRIAAAGGTVLAYLVTDPRENNFPRLPVRQDIRVFVWLAGADDPVSLNRVLIPAVTEVPPDTSDQQWVLRLAPTARSRLHGRVFGMPRSDGT
ncbi:MAG: NIPSNAP family protein [Candidatus Dormiibacterota bacterium]